MIQGIERTVMWFSKMSLKGKTKFLQKLIHEVEPEDRAYMQAFLWPTKDLILELAQKNLATRILYFFDLPSISKTSRTCLTWNTLVRGHNAYWRAIAEHYGFYANEIGIDHKDWYPIAKRSVLSWKAWGNVENVDIQNIQSRVGSINCMRFCRKDPSVLVIAGTHVAILRLDRKEVLTQPDGSEKIVPDVLFFKVEFTALEERVKERITCVDIDTSLGLIAYGTSTGFLRTYCIHSGDLIPNRKSILPRPSMPPLMALCIDGDGVVVTEGAGTLFRFPYSSSEVLPGKSSQLLVDTQIVAIEIENDIMTVFGVSRFNDIDRRFFQTFRPPPRSSIVKIYKRSPLRRPPSYIAQLTEKSDILNGLYQRDVFPWTLITQFCLADESYSCAYSQSILAFSGPSISLATWEPCGYSIVKRGVFSSSGNSEAYIAQVKSFKIGPHASQVALSGLKRHLPSARAFFEGSKPLNCTKIDVPPLVDQTWIGHSLWHETILLALNDNAIYVLDISDAKKDPCLLSKIPIISAFDPRTLVSNGHGLVAVGFKNGDVQLFWFTIDL